MAFGSLPCSVLFTIIISLSSAVSSKFSYHVPVLLWGPSNQNIQDDQFSSLARISTDDFTHYLSKIFHKVNENAKGNKCAILACVEETLSVEDFSFRDSDNVGAFPSLKSVLSTPTVDLHYFTSVENPATTFSSPELKNSGVSVVEENEIASVNNAHKGCVMYVVKMEDADSSEDRPQMLRRHDKQFIETYKKLSNDYDSVFGILTGTMGSWTGPEEIAVRVRRQSNDSAVPNDTISGSNPDVPVVKATSGVLLQANKVFIYTTKPPVLKIADKEVELVNHIKEVQVLDDRETWLRAVFGYQTDLGKVNLRFRFDNISNSAWKLSWIELEDGKSKVNLVTPLDITAPFGWSYHTSSSVVFSNDKSSLTFSNLQVQPWMSAGEAKFGPAEDSATYFTVPIWTGLIVTGLIGIILMWALSMILDIRTMDQFDDPKGKTITVNVSE